MAFSPREVQSLVGIISDLASVRSTPLIVAVDGRSGAGKSTLTSRVRSAIGAAVIAGDDFYTGVPAERWDTMTTEQRVDQVFDWRRQRSVLEALADRRHAAWRPYDWYAMDGRLAERQTCEPEDVVILEGVYSARPELEDLVDVRVLLNTPPVLRQARLLEREGDLYRSEWKARWSAAEEFYFTTVVPQHTFDVVLAP